ncbi:MAG: type II toxin-antitoxin system PemK/MazF family toxin [Bacteroidales bacterium]|nr:type II toxin-antitoxin system PemK/MazF family toxin [Bacteroidales bacterium]
MEISQYDIVLVDLQVSEMLRGSGAEIRKARPCVVISPDEMNRYLRTVVVAPVTTRSRLMPTRVRVRHNQQTGWIVVDQIRTVDRKRISKKLDRLTHPEIRKLKNVIRETYVD